MTRLLLLLLLIRSTTSLCIYGLLYHLLYVYLYDRWMTRFHRLKDIPYGGITLIVRSTAAHILQANVHKY
jgi:hypothetical protein